MTTQTYDVLIIGAGPAGMSTAIEAQRRGLSALLVDKGCLVNSIFDYPTDMVFFTTPELLELGGVPFSSAHQKPTRQEVLEYYRKVSEYEGLELRLYHTVEKVTGADGDFRVHTRDRNGSERAFAARKLVFAAGYYDQPNRLNVPGEELAKVSHYYKEPHPYFAQEVLVVGGKNSAALAALDLWRHGARVTLVHRRDDIGAHVKYWVRPDIENRIKNGEIRAFFESTVKRIEPDSVLLETPDGERRLANDAVLALIGYHPNFTFMESLGLEFTGLERRPVCDPLTFECNVDGLYLAGVVVGGLQTNEIFIENGRDHGRAIAEALAKRLK